jgi:hypothetical protein
MMLDELTLLLKGTRADASRETSGKAVVEENLLGKPTASSREKTNFHLQRAYTLDYSKVLWRVLRQFFEREPQALVHYPYSRLAKVASHKRRALIS